MEYVIEIDNLTKDYQKGFWRKKKIRALDDLSLQVRRGQIYGFLGGNGAGKTTTIKILMNLIFPTSGSARILGRDVSDFRMHRRIGYCPENPYFYDYLKARELMIYFGKLFGLEPAAAEKKSAELLAQVGLEEKHWNKQLRKFSKGMLQRVGLAQALINEPEIVFLDEPMSGLDPLGRRDIRELIADLRERGTTVFMCSHILSDIEALCDNVAILQSGRLIHEGNLTDLLNRQGEPQSFEIVAKNVRAEDIENEISRLGEARVFSKASGVNIQIADEKDIDRVLEIIRRADGRLVSVQPVKQDLEELFLPKS